MPVILEVSDHLRMLNLHVYNNRYRYALHVLNDLEAHLRSYMAQNELWREDIIEAIRVLRCDLTAGTREARNSMDDLQRSVVEELNVPLL